MARRAARHTWSLLAEMIDVALIELEQLLGCSVDELIALVKPMSAVSKQRS